jgi:hypothetical protein
LAVRRDDGVVAFCQKRRGKTATSKERKCLHLLFLACKEGWLLGCLGLGFHHGEKKRGEMGCCGLG